MFKIVGNYQGETTRRSRRRIIDEGFNTTGYARRMLWEYVQAFGPNWGPMWVEDRQGNRIGGDTGHISASGNAAWFAAFRRL